MPAFFRESFRSSASGHSVRPPASPFVPRGPPRRCPWAVTTTSRPLTTTRFSFACEADRPRPQAFPDIVCPADLKQRSVNCQWKIEKQGNAALFKKWAYKDVTFKCSPRGLTVGYTNSKGVDITGTVNEVEEVDKKKGKAGFSLLGNYFKAARLTFADIDRPELILHGVKREDVAEPAKAGQGGNAGAPDPFVSWLQDLRTKCPSPYGVHITAFGGQDGSTKVIDVFAPQMSSLDVEATATGATVPVSLDAITSTLKNLGLAAKLRKDYAYSATFSQWLQGFVGQCTGLKQTETEKVGRTVLYDVARRCKNNDGCAATIHTEARATSRATNSDAHFKWGSKTFIDKYLTRVVCVKHGSTDMPALKPEKSEIERDSMEDRPGRIDNFQGHTFPVKSTDADIAKYLADLLDVVDDREARQERQKSLGREAGWRDEIVQTDIDDTEFAQFWAYHGCTVIP